MSNSDYGFCPSCGVRIPVYWSDRTAHCAICMRSAGVIAEARSPVQAARDQVFAYPTVRHIDALITEVRSDSTALVADVLPDALRLLQEWREKAAAEHALAKERSDAGLEVWSSYYSGRAEMQNRCANELDALITASTEAPKEQSVRDDDLGLSIDMLDADRLREWARLILIHGNDIGHWGSVPHVANKLQLIATGIEKAVRDIGILRRAPATGYHRCICGHPGDDPLCPVDHDQVSHERTTEAPKEEEGDLSRVDGERRAAGPTGSIASGNEVAPLVEAALRRILDEPHGCRFCDSGKLRNPLGGHDDDCGYEMATFALSGLL